MTLISATIYNLPYLSIDIINIIFSYMQSNTNKIMKEHINDVEPCYTIFCNINKYYKRENHLKTIMTVMKIYGVKFTLQNMNILLFIIKY